MVYEWLTGTWPFQGDWFALGHQKLTQEPPSLRAHVPTIPTAVDQAVKKALARDPKDRFESVRAFAEALEQAAQAPEEQKVVSVRTMPVPAGTGPAGTAAESSRSLKEWLDVGRVHRRAKRYQEALAEQIARLNQAGKMSFKEAMGLRVGGRSAYSRWHLQELVTAVGAAGVALIDAAFPWQDSGGAQSAGDSAAVDGAGFSSAAGHSQGPG